jgi:hypothetical protein
MQSRATQEHKGPICSLYLSQIISEWGRISTSINIHQQDHSEKGSMYCVIKCIVRGNQLHIKNADLHHVMYKCKSSSSVHNVLMFCWLYIIVYQYSGTNVTHFLLNLLIIKGLYILWALLANPQEVLQNQHLVYCVRVMSVGCNRIPVPLQSWCNELT